MYHTSGVNYDGRISTTINNSEPDTNNQATNDLKIQEYDDIAGTTTHLAGTNCEEDESEGVLDNISSFILAPANVSEPPTNLPVCHTIQDEHFNDVELYNYIAGFVAKKYYKELTFAKSAENFFKIITMVIVYSNSYPLSYPPPGDAATVSPRSVTGHLPLLDLAMQPSCPHCGKGVSRKDNVIRHVRSTCPYKKDLLEPEEQSKHRMEMPLKRKRENVDIPQHKVLCPECNDTAILLSSPSKNQSSQS
ncbi:hypothetical protein FQA39_LY17307 [Lamprigera yunnana]|nr:hypothetical protein FQA39_LY17307 [Lamprigera yunnana]